MNEIIALVIGGSNNVLAEWRAALDLCSGRPTVNFVCNAMIGDFPDAIDNAVTLHPDHLSDWISRRRTAERPDATRVWAHRPYNSVTNTTRDVQGSVGLFSVKIARQEGYTKIIACGVPMTVEDEHFKRRVRWNAAHGFRRGWTNHRVELSLAQCFRSMSGWTREQFGFPDAEWLQSVVDIPPLRPRIFSLKA